MSRSLRAGNPHHQGSEEWHFDHQNLVWVNDYSSPELGVGENGTRASVSMSPEEAADVGDYLLAVAEKRGAKSMPGVQLWHDRTPHAEGWIFLVQRGGGQATVYRLFADGSSRIMQCHAMGDAYVVDDSPYCETYRVGDSGELSISDNEGFITSIQPNEKPPAKTARGRAWQDTSPTNAGYILISRGPVSETTGLQSSTVTRLYDDGSTAVAICTIDGDRHRVTCSNTNETYTEQIDGTLLVTTDKLAPVLCQPVAFIWKDKTP